MYTVLETIPLTTESHKVAGVAVWVERDQIGWHAYMTTPIIENQYISSRFYEASLDELKTMAVACADQAVLDLTPKAAKKTRTTAKKASQEPIITAVEKDVSLPFHTLDRIVLVVKTVMVKYPKKKATFEYEMFMNNVYKGFCLSMDAATQGLYELARTEIHERNMTSMARAA